MSNVELKSFQIVKLFKHLQFPSSDSSQQLGGIFYIKSFTNSIILEMRMNSTSRSFRRNMTWKSIFCASILTQCWKTGVERTEIKYECAERQKVVSRQHSKAGNACRGRHKSITRSGDEKLFQLLRWQRAYGCGSCFVFVFKYSIRHIKFGPRSCEWFKSTDQHALITECIWGSRKKTCEREIHLSEALFVYESTACCEIWWRRLSTLA